MQPEARKTARCFHAKDDCPEVRREVFRVLKDWDIRVQVGVRRKSSLIDAARSVTGKKSWKADPVYDSIVTTLFKTSLHKVDRCVLVFARRGKSDRERALSEAIAHARSNFQRDTGILPAAHARLISSTPSESCGLQAIDYFLWALQRLYERGEDRFFGFVADHYSVIMDFDDKRDGNNYGRWYNKQDPLTLQEIKPVTG